MKKAHMAGAAGACGAGAVAICLTFTPVWEGLDLVAKRDKIGTGNPITYCNGLTSADGAVRIGQKFTPAQCKSLLANVLPGYWEKIEPCIKVRLPIATAASLLDASFNAGPERICKSPMLAKMNAGDIKGGCNAFDGWIIRSGGAVRKGLIARRNTKSKLLPKPDPRKGEKQLCLEGLSEPPVKSWLESFLDNWRLK